MIYGYIRVSSDKQTVENQRFEINNFCNDQKMKIDGWIEETISGNIVVVTGKKLVWGDEELPAVKHHHRNGVEQDTQVNAQR